MYTDEQIKQQKLIDDQLLNNCWGELEKNLSDRSDASTAKRIREAFEEYYRDVYQAGDVVEWVANLYSPIHGGFYYSNSARHPLFLQVRTFLPFALILWPTLVG